MTEIKRPDDANKLRELVSEGYAKIVEEKSNSCCRGSAERATSRKLGYTDEELDIIPDGANLGVGCGNPTAIDTLEAGETVVDLGSGAGMDAFLAASQVGAKGRVIGVDMTDAMLAKARQNAEKAGVRNVEFRKGNIEDLPIEDETVDAILSNCVINLSPEKAKVYREAYRVLKPGGRVMVSDIVLDRPLPQEILDSMDAYIGCVGGATLRADYLQLIRDAGFREVRVTKESGFGQSLSLDDPGVREIIDRMGISDDEARGHIDAVRSLSVWALK